MPAKDAEAMMKEIDNVNGVKTTLGFNSLVGTAIPEELIPDNLRDLLKSDKYQLMLINSEYKVATDNVNQQIDAINTIVHKYDANGMLIGEAPCTKDMIEITDHDFKVVDMISIIAIFVIIALVLRSVSLPVILVAVIEFAIFINLGIPYLHECFASIYCADLHQHHPAWCNGRLCNSDDLALQTGTQSRQRQERPL